MADSKSNKNDKPVVKKPNKIQKWWNETVGELRKVTWPTKEEAIKSKPLGKCIQEDVSEAKVKKVAERAVWLGNDETHYVRKWKEKDVDDLVSLIFLTVHWIESEIETEKLLESMSVRK